MTPTQLVQAARAVVDEYRSHGGIMAHDHCPFACHLPAEIDKLETALTEEPEDVRAQAFRERDEYTLQVLEAELAGWRNGEGNLVAMARSSIQRCIDRLKAAWELQK